MVNISSHLYMALKRKKILAIYKKQREDRRLKHLNNFSDHKDQTYEGCE